MDNFLLLPRVVASTLADSAFAIVFGAVVACLWLKAEDDALQGRLRWNALLGLIALLLALGAQMFLQTATMIGSSDFSLIRSQIAAVLTGTHAGRALVCESAALLLPLILLLTRFGRQTRAGIWSVLASLVILAAGRSAIGHSAGDGDFTLAEFVQLIHLVSTAIWAGSVITAGLVVLPAMLRGQRIDAMGRFTRSLSRTVTVALLLIVLSGLYNSYRGLGGSLAPLGGTQWGRLLDLKLALIGVALTLGAFSRKMLGGDRALATQECSRLATLVRVEATVMLLILTVSAWLANSPPANQF
jgi:putative copper resistance protein D